MKNIIVVGHKGKMGSVVFEKLRGLGFSVFGKEKTDDWDGFDDAWLVIDFGGAKSSVESAIWCKRHNVKLVVGSTGQDENQMAMIKEASNVVPVILAGNFSVGVLMMKRMVELMKTCEVESVCVFEKHHKKKLDAPSGTAKELKVAIEKNIEISPQMLCERGGAEVGTHVIDFYFGSECVSVSHKAFSRDAFANGVVLAVDFMKNIACCGLFDFEDVFDKMSKNKNF